MTIRLLNRRSISITWAPISAAMRDSTPRTSIGVTLTISISPLNQEFSSS